MQECRRDQVVGRVSPRPSAGKLTDPGPASRRWRSSTPTFAGKLTGRKVSSQTFVGKLTSRWSRHASGVARATTYRSGISPRQYRSGISTLFVSLLATLAFSATPVFAIGDASTLPGEKCPNENLSGFSSQLAECRAFEQVTPPFKDGARAHTFGLSASGAGAIAESLGGFAGTQSEHTLQGGIYLFSRSGSGWQPSAVSPSQASFPAAEQIAQSTGLERGLWFARTPSQSLFDEDFYVREADGAMVEVGPVLDPALTAGPPAREEGHFYWFNSIEFQQASDNLSHVVFTLLSGAPLWPGDTTYPQGEVTPSLYEYAGTGLAAPELVGVSDGSSERAGKTLPAGQLISDCGTALGSQNRNDTYNAVSGDGETVFFTAEGVSHCPGSVEHPEAPEVSEVFARVGGYRTVPISEPTVGTLAACASCLEGSRQPAEFAGASEDGLQAFFLTEQELLPGAKSMNLYEYDVNAPKGQKVIQVSAGAPEAEVLGVARVSEDGSHVYFVAKGVLTGADREGRSPVAGADNLYVYERDEAFPSGRLAFVATLGESEAELHTKEAACGSAIEPEACEEAARSEFTAKNNSDAEDWRLKDKRPVQATPDGRFLVFESVADLTAGDMSSLDQVFEYDAQSEELVRVSVGQKGYAEGEEHATENQSQLPRQEFSLPRKSPAEKDTGLAVSGDGGTVVFGSVGALVQAAEAAEAAGVPSVYEYHSSVGSVGGSIGDGDVYLVSNGDSVFEAESRGIDGSGGDVFFEGLLETVDLLAGGDSQYDLYDARVDGGFSLPAAGAECSGESCQSGTAPLIQPILPPPSSASVTGNSNLTPPPPSKLEPPAEPSTPKVTKPKTAACKKGFVKKGRKCVKSKSKKKAKSKGKKK
jgi:hypothetical protein